MIGEHTPTVIMVAEKAADLIAGNTPLPPDHREYYRHQPSAAEAHGA